jgi:hypothetical protein
MIYKYIKLFSKMTPFTNEEYDATHFMYGLCDGSAIAASSEYQRRYPDRRQPSRRVSMVHHNLKEIDAFMPQTHVCHGRLNVQNGDELLDAVHANLSISTRQVAYTAGLSRNAV